VTEVAISAEERDALHGELLAYMGAIDLVWGRVASPDAPAGRLEHGFPDELLLVLDDLDRDDGPYGEGRVVELSTPPEILRRVLSRIHGDLTDAGRDDLLVAACERILAALDRERS
jgi:hypothetical protein